MTPLFCKHIERWLRWLAGTIRGRLVSPLCPVERSNPVSWAGMMAIGSGQQMSQPNSGSGTSSLPFHERRSRQAESVCDGGGVVDVSVDGGQAAAHRDHRDVGAACLAPGIDLRCNFADAPRRKHHVIPAEVFD